MDIRSFFNPKAKSKGGKSEPIGGNTNISRDTIKKKRRGIVFNSDSSSDEELLPKRSSKKLNSSDVIFGSGDWSIDQNGKGSKTCSSKKLNSDRKKSAETTAKPVLKEITPDSFFACSTVMQKEDRIVKRKASNKINMKKTKREVIEIDDELDLGETLQMTPKKKMKREVIQDPTSEASKYPVVVQKQQKISKTEKQADDDSKRSVVEVEGSKNSLKRAKEGKKLHSPKWKNSPGVEQACKQDPTQKVTPEKKVAGTISHEASSEKQQNYAKYMKWQNRTGPKAPGSKEIPQGEENCLEGLIFVISGVLESLERDEAKSLIERYGGKVTVSLSSRTSYLLLGEDAGESKMKKAEQLKTKQLDEDGLLNLIRTKPGKKSKYEIDAEKEVEKSKANHKKSDYKNKPPEKEPKIHGPASAFSGGCSQDANSSTSSLPDSQKLASDPSYESLLWVDKYKPKTLKQIIGQQGAKSNVEKLRKWLLDWQANNRPTDGSKPKRKPAVNMWGGGGDPTGAGFKAALLSGPPGVGKTTAATLVCQELGFEYIEMNASDTRSKRMLKEVVSEMTDNTSISNMFGNQKLRKTAASGTRNALIMDEIDGMAGNEDRGGMQEIIQLIKTTKMPIICMCNDRSSPKMRSLTNHCFDLRFQRPRVEQITGAMMSICYKEGVKISAPALQALIRGCNQDLRQVLYNLSMLKVSNKAVSYEEAKKHADGAQKDVSVGIFDIARKLLTSESASLSTNEKLSLFFMDYSIIPLFIQNNYPHIRTTSAAGNIHKQLGALSKTADSIALGDHVDRLIRSDQAWSALPTLGLLSTVVPCDVMRGGMSGMINFPSFFGKLSTTGKNHRLLQELKFHSSLVTAGANEETFNLDYLPYLRYHLTQPLIKQSQSGDPEVHKTTALMEAYDLLREDFDSIVEIGQYPGKLQPMTKVDTKVKSAFTRTFNKESHPVPYAVESTAKKTKRAETDLGFGLEEESQLSPFEEENDGGLDAMVKAKPSQKKSISSSNTKSRKKSQGASKKSLKK